MTDNQHLPLMPEILDLREAVSRAPFPALPTACMSKIDEIDVEPHHAAIGAHHRFPTVTFRGATWDLSHLDTFAFRADVGPYDSPLLIDVVVLFSCHCFTRGTDGFATSAASESYADGREVRILCEERYLLSRRFLPQIVKELFSRKIRVASDRPNYVTLETVDLPHPGFYLMFFEVTKDLARKKRLLLRVQSAYRVDALTARQRNAGKVNFDVLLRATYEGRKIKG